MTNDAWWAGVRARRKAEGKAGLATDTLWALTKDGHVITATIALVPSYGRELRLTCDGEVWRTRMYRGEDLRPVFDAALTMRAELEARGWIDTGRL